MFDQSLTDPKNTTPAEVLADIKKKVDDLYTMKMTADKAEKIYKENKNILSAILEEAGVDKMQGDYCNVSLALKSSVSMPKEDKAKLDLFWYIANKDTSQADPAFVEIVKTNFMNFLSVHPTLLSMITINAASFNSWYAAEIEAQAKLGDTEFKLPMISKPYEYYSLGIRKRNKK